MKDQGHSKVLTPQTYIGERFLFGICYLKCYCFLYLTFSPNLGQFSHFTPPENARKTKVFWCFQGLKNGSIVQK